MNTIIYFNIFILSIILLLIFIYNNNKEAFETTSSINSISSGSNNKNLDLDLDYIFKEVINNTSTYKTSLECVDDVIVTIFENNKKDMLFPNVSENNKLIRNFCNGKHYTSKQYLDKFLYLKEDKYVPNKVRKLNIKQLNNKSINISWFPPESTQKEGDTNIRIKEHSIKQYICILKNISKNTVKMYISNSINNDKSKIIDHIIIDLIPKDNYIIYVLSENINGFGKIVKKKHTQEEMIKPFDENENENRNEDEDCKSDPEVDYYLGKKPYYHNLKILT